MPKLTSKADLDKLVTDKIPESLTLEYKASPSLKRDSKSMNELCKDVSAFANSAGGQVIYGIEEQGHFPSNVDGGVSAADITREWIEQILLSRVQPRLDGLLITPIDVSQQGSHFAYVVSVPGGTALAPYQAPDNKYYRRHNFLSEPMEDYEVRDMMRRVTSPELRLLVHATPTTLSLLAGANHTSRQDVVVSITNKANEPALYCSVQIYFDKRLLLAEKPKEWTVGEAVWKKRASPEGSDEDFAVTVLSRNFNVPSHLPFFKGKDWTICSLQLVLATDVFLDGNGEFVFGYDVSAPGCQFAQLGSFTLAKKQLKFAFPNEGRSVS